MKFELSKEFIDIVAPKHNRASCDEHNLNNAIVFNGEPKCTRCFLLMCLEHGGSYSGYALKGIEYVKLNIVPEEMLELEDDEIEAMKKLKQKYGQAKLDRIMKYI